MLGSTSARSRPITPALWGTLERRRREWSHGKDIGAPRVHRYLSH
jgi:hypothetical protein